MGNCVSRIRLKSKRGKHEGPCDWRIDYEETGVLGSGVCTCPNTVGSCSCPPGAAPSPSCVFYSPRIEALLDGERTEERTTRDHWTNVDPENEAEVKRVGEDNRVYFDEVLVKHPEWGRFFTKFEDLEIGAKIGEGGQAEIFEAMSMNNSHVVAKVWKEGVSLRDLEQQWPPRLLLKVVHDVEGPFENIYGGAFIKDGEFINMFAFVMQRQWSDLRSHIDKPMLKLFDHNTHNPLFCKIEQVTCLIHHVWMDLKALHL